MLSPRRFLTSRSAVYLLLLVAGLLIFAAVSAFGPPTRIVIDPNTTKATTSLPQPSWGSVRLIQQSPWYIVLLMPVAMIMITVSIFEVIKSGVEYWLNYFSHRRRFDEFFGDDASSHGDKAVIILEPTNVPELLEQILPEVSRRMNVPERNRFFKARHWVNRWDAEGAKAIREMFSKNGYPAPELSHLTNDLDASTPFAFSMGLGFTQESLKIVKEACEPWLRISVSGSGDRVELKHQLINDSIRLFTVKRTSDENDFKELIPNNWDLTKWISKPDDVRDYAMILRHTRRHQQGRQVIFVLGGFTEHGTAAAGHYLGKHWLELWKRHVKGSGHSGSFGDFMILIEGPSDVKDMRLWRQDPNLPAITPDLLRNPYHIDCEWSARLSPQTGATGA